MLSPHELATLMLIRHSSGVDKLDRHDLESLCERALIELHLEPEAGMPRAALTHSGQSLLDTMARLR
jgi:hypothetical protein